ncbi:hypothetical protein [Piscicoccus intestinalis]|uniref:hypothetical protein n=1 Tax=Piscicoccus intestinalis TaxID=746033 RepID=UPI0008398E1D|nr:hypothetical protein [Piscicoccus intestinalis]
MSTVADGRHNDRHDDRHNDRHDDQRVRSSDTAEVDVNNPDLQGRRGTEETTRTSRITVNSGFADEVGPEGVRAYVDTLTAVAGGAAGRAPSEILEELTRGWERAGVRVPEPEAALIADRIVDGGAETLVVVAEDGQVLYGEDVAPDGGESSARQDEPDDPDRPLYS